LERTRSEAYALGRVSCEHEAEHEAVHRRLCEYARHRSALDAAEAFDLVRAEQFKLYALHACASHYEYMERVLGYGPHAARERMRVARALVRLPETTAALARGELSYSAVRELTRVATDETESAWLARAKGLVVNQIERMVAHHQLGDRPTIRRIRTCDRVWCASSCHPRCSPSGARRARSSPRSEAARSAMQTSSRRCAAP
jgi:hypothetical protein